MPAISVTAPVGPAGAPLVVLGPSLGTSTILWEDVDPGSGGRLPRRRMGPAGARRLTRGDRAVHRSKTSPTRSRAVAPVSRCPALRRRLARGCGRAGAGAAASVARASRRDRRVGREAGRAFGVGGARRAGARAVDLEPDRRLGPALVRARLDRAPPRAVGPTAARAAGRRRRELRPVLRRARRLRRAPDALGEIRMPVLAAVGRARRASPPRRSRPRSRRGVVDGAIVQIPDAAHLPPAEQPDAVAAALRDFFEEAR